MKATIEQQNIINAVQAGKDVLVQALAGSGKAQPLDEIVITPNGCTTMREIQIGDYVISEEGRPIKVLDTITTEDLMMYEITFADGSSTRCCKDHLWKINRKTRVNGKACMVTEVRPLTYMLPLVAKYRTKPSSFAYPYSIEVCKPVEFTDLPVTIDSYFMGYFLGNGHSSAKGNACRISMHEDDVEEIKNKLTLQGSREVQYASKSYDIHYSVALNKLLSVYKLCGVKSLYKFIPNDYKYNSINNRIALLRGLMDSDGTCKNNKARFSTSSLSLANDTVQLVRSLGGRATLVKQIRPDRSNTELTISIRTPFNPFSLTRKAKEYIVRQKDSTNTNSIVNIVYIGKQTGKCLVVDSPQHLYLTKDYIVTHNSTTLRLIAEDNPSKNFLVLCFNSANADESNAHRNKPNNVVYSTVHSLAYQATMKNPAFKKKLNSYLDYTNLDNDFIVEVVGSLPIDGKKYNEVIFKVKRALLDVVVYYCRTDKLDITEYSTSLLTSWFTKPEEGKENEYYRNLELSSTQITSLAEYVKDYWLRLIDASKPDKITHDVYLKLFELQKAAIHNVYDKKNKCDFSVDVIALDETQDSNAVTYSIFANQKHLQQVAVGDSNQSLYSWRGASGNMNKLKEFTSLPLCISFRFNQDIANTANKILSLNTSLRLIGAGTKTVIDTKAHLCRTNATVLSTSIMYMEQGLKVYANIDLNDLFSKLWHIQSCHFNEKPKYPNKELSNIVDKQSLDEAMNYNDQLALIVKLGIYLNQKYGNLTKAKVAISGKILSDANGSDITVSTVHRSKGLEFSHVIVDEDLIPDSESNPRDVTEWLSNFDNCALCYVAITRSEVELILPNYLNEYLEG